MPDIDLGHWHAGQQQLARYALGELDEVTSWSVETHLDRCGECRRRLAGQIAGTPAGGLVDAAGAAMAPALPAVRVHRSGVIRTAPLRRLRRFAGPALGLPFLLSVATVLTVAGSLDAVRPGPVPALLLLLAPVLPLLGIAACYGRGIDPAYEMVVATPAAGLRLVLLRATGVLAVCVPATALAGLLTGRAAPVLWLLPCLALAVLTLGLGGLLGLPRAAMLVAVGWAGVVVLPALATSSVPAAVSAAARPLWVVVLLAAAVLVLAR